MTPRRKRWLAVGVALVLLGSAFLWALPEIVRRVALTQIHQLTGRAASLEDVDLNLFTGRLALKKFRLADREGPDAFLEFERLDARLALLSVLASRVRLTELTLAGSSIRLVRKGPADFNFSDLLPVTPKPTPTVPARRTRWAVSVDRLAMVRGSIVAHDRVPSPPREWRVQDLTIEGAGLTTRPADPPGSLTVQARVDQATLKVAAESLRLGPGSPTVRVSLHGFDLAWLRPYVPAEVPAFPEAGKVSLTLALGLANGDEGLRQARASGEVTVEGLALTQQERPAPFATVPRITVRIKEADLLARTTTIGAVEVEGLNLRLTRDRAGKIDLLAMAPPAGDRAQAAAQPAAQDKPSQPPPRILVERLALGSGTITLADHTPSPPREWRVEGLTIAASRLANWQEADPGRLEVRAELAARPNARSRSVLKIEADSLRLSPASASVRATLEGFDLADIGSYLPPTLPASPTAGRVGVTLALAVEGGPEGLSRATASGSVRIAGLVVAQAGRSVPFLTLPRLTIGVKQADLVQRMVTLGPIEAESLDLRAVRDRAGRIDLLGLAETGPAGAGPGPAPSAPRAPPAARSTATPEWRVRLERLALAKGRATFEDQAVSPATTLALTDLTLSVERATWPPAGPATLSLAAGLPGGGRTEVKGSATLKPVGADLQLAMRDAPIEPYQAYLPFPARVSGRLSSDTRAEVHLDNGKLTALTRGSTRAGDVVVRMPDAPAPVLRVEHIALDGIDVGWPTYAKVAKVTLTRPVVTVERAPDGQINLRRLFAPDRPPASAPPPAAATSTAPAPGGPGTALAPLGGLAVDIGEILIEDGYARFLDHTPRPAFAQEVSRLALSVKGLSTAPAQRARVAAQAIVGGDAALDLRGEVAPLGTVVFADLVGELRDFSLPNVNPYSDSLLSWIFRQGKFGARVHFRIAQDQLTVQNDLVVANLEVAPSGAADQVQRRIGLPLSMIVALIKDSRGDIRLSVPVAGSLNEWRVGWTQVIKTAVKNVLMNVLAAPFRAIGRLFTRGGKVEALAVEPVTFAPGSTVIAPAMEGHLTRVADFLRRSPFIKLTLTPIAAGPDLEALKGQELTARIQRIQRERGLPDFAIAVGVHFRERLSGVTPPEKAEEQLALLRAREPVPDSRVAELLERRSEATREALVKMDGIGPDRLVAGKPATAPTASGDGRVEFTVTQ